MKLSWTCHLYKTFHCTYLCPRQLRFGFFFFLCISGAISCRCLLPLLSSEIPLDIGSHWCPSPRKFFPQLYEVQELLAVFPEKDSLVRSWLPSRCEQNSLICAHSKNLSEIRQWWGWKDLQKETENVLGETRVKMFFKLKAIYFYRMGKAWAYSHDGLAGSIRCC